MTDQIRFIHNNKNPRLRYSAAYTFTKNEDGTLKIVYGVSQCSRVDTFSRKIGRSVAESRLRKALTGKVAPNSDTATGAALVPMYGVLSTDDAPGLSVGRFVESHFESVRNAALEYNNQPSAMETLLSQMLGLK